MRTVPLPYSIIFGWLGVIGFLASGCAAPLGHFQDPHPLGAGNNRVGASTTFAAMVFPSCCEVHGLEASVWLDHGGESVDSRFRLSAILPTEYDDSDSPWLAGLSYEAKFPGKSGGMATVLGGQMSMTTVSETLVFASGWVGALFGAGNPGNVRLLGSTLAALGIFQRGFLFSMQFNIGVEIPISGSLSIRPELMINLLGGAGFEGDATGGALAGGGLALIF